LHPLRRSRLHDLGGMRPQGRLDDHEHESHCRGDDDNGLDDGATTLGVASNRLLGPASKGRERQFIGIELAFAVTFE
jgi:hypothetical protein